MQLCGWGHYAEWGRVSLACGSLDKVRAQGQAFLHHDFANFPAVSNPTPRPVTNNGNRVGAAVSMPNRLALNGRSRRVVFASEPLMSCLDPEGV